jgi:hypothetical protein
MGDYKSAEALVRVLTHFRIRLLLRTTNISTHIASGTSGILAFPNAPEGR